MTGLFRCLRTANDSATMSEWTRSRPLSRSSPRRFSSPSWLVRQTPRTMVKPLHPAVRALRHRVRDMEARGAVRDKAVAEVLEAARADKVAARRFINPNQERRGNGSFRDFHSILPSTLKYTTSTFSKPKQPKSMHCMPLVAGSFVISVLEVGNHIAPTRATFPALSREARWILPLPMNYGWTFDQPSFATS